MHFYLPLFAALAALASTQTMSLTEVLAANNKTIGTLANLIQGQPALVAALTSAQGITILAPSNDAFSKFLSTPAGMSTSGNPTMLTALLQYHVLNGILNSSAITTQPQYAPSLLTSTQFTNVTGGQVVMVEKMSDNKFMVMSGLKEMSMVTTADVLFTGGVVHIIDTVLTMPMMPSISAVDSSLTALAGALTTANLVTAVDGMKDVTIFAPSNAAFQKIGSAAPSLMNNMAMLMNVLEYHVINNTVGYAGLLMAGLANQSYPTVMGSEVRVEAVKKKVFANSAQVVITDIIVANGVMHVIDNVLNPANTTATPIPTATSQAVAFAGVSSASSVPFTSGISATTTAPSASTMTGSANRESAMGAVALLGMGIMAAF